MHLASNKKSNRIKFSQKIKIILKKFLNLGL